MNRITWAWKNESVRSGLSPAELAELPENPAGAIDELDDAYLDSVIGGTFDTCFVCTPSPPPPGGDPCAKKPPPKSCFA